MATAAVIYRSAKGTTRQLAEEIGAHLAARGYTTTVQSVGEADLAATASVDVLLLGCWTSGLLVVAQHPDEPWLAFVRDLPALTSPKVGLFTTYKIATGSMFSKMRAALAGTSATVGLELKTRDGHLSDAGRAALDRFLGGP